MKKFLSLMVVLLGVSACTVVPDPIQVAEDAQLVSFEEVKGDVAQNQQLGKNARWGGRIASVENKKDVSEIEIVFFPESSSGKPRIGKESGGRFKAIVSGFIDPLVFEQGRLITVVGEVGEAQNGIIGEQDYIYPTVNAIGYHMWKQTTNIDVDPVGFVPFHYGRGFYGHSLFANPWHVNPFYHAAWGPWADPWATGFRSRIRVTHNEGHSQGARVAPPKRTTKEAPTPKTAPRTNHSIKEPADKTH